MSIVRRSQPTIYAGIQFRSKLEADWARVFDALQMPWQYEREGRWLGDVYYLPDFWLPDAGQFVEVKGVLGADDLLKVDALCTHTPQWPHHPTDSADVCLVAARPDGWFHGWPRMSVHPVKATDLGLDLALYRCRQCRGTWFAERLVDDRCRCCGHDPAWPERHTLLHDGVVTPWPLHPRKAA